MNDLILDGFGLLVLGMGFVYVFLVVLIFATKFMSRLLTRYFPEVIPVAKTSVAKVATTEKTLADTQLTAVITAAIHQHRSKQ